MDASARKKRARRMRRLWADPKWAATRIAAMQIANNEPTHRRKLSRSKKALWRDPAWRELTVAAIQAAGAQRRKPKPPRVEKKCQCETACQKMFHGKSIYAPGHNPASHHLSPEKEAAKALKCSQTSKGRLVSKKTRRRRARTLRRRYRKEPEFYAALAARNRARNKTLEMRAIISEKAKQRWANPEFHAKASLAMAEAFKERTQGRNQFETGYLNSKKAGRVFSRSSWERALLEILDASSLVAEVKYEPFAIPFKLDGVTRTYFPDFYIRLCDGREFLIEIRSPMRASDARSRAQYRAATTFCEARGIEFRVFMDKVTSMSELIQ